MNFGFVLHWSSSAHFAHSSDSSTRREHALAHSDRMKAALGLMLRAAVPRPTFSQLRREPCFRDAPMLDGAEVAAELRTLWPEPWADGGGGCASRGGEGHVAPPCACAHSYSHS